MRGREGAQPTTARSCARSCELTPTAVRPGEPTATSVHAQAERSQHPLLLPLICGTSRPGAAPPLHEAAPNRRARWDGPPDPEEERGFGSLWRILRMATAPSCGQEAALHSAPGAGRGLRAAGLQIGNNGAGRIRRAGPPSASTDREVTASLLFTT